MFLNIFQDPQKESLKEELINAYDDLIKLIIEELKDLIKKYHKEIEKKQNSKYSKDYKNGYIKAMKEVIKDLKELTTK